MKLLLLLLLIPATSWGQSACLSTDAYTTAAGYYLPVDGYVTNLSCQMQSIPYTVHTLTVRYNQADTVVRCTLADGYCRWLGGTDGPSLKVSKGYRLTIKQTDAVGVDGQAMQCLVGISDKP